MRVLEPSDWVVLIAGFYLVTGVVILQVRKNSNIGCVVFAVGEAIGLFGMVIWAVAHIRVVVQ